MAKTKKSERFDAIYARQSVDKRDSVSIEAQIDDCKVKCSGKIRVYKDKGYSGKNIERPDLQRLMDDIEAGIIKKVVVYKLDRISRNIVDFYKLYQFMEDYDCVFASRTEEFDTATTMGKGMMGILAVFAQMERENIQTRIKDNYAYRVKMGVWCSGKAPFGFKNGKIDGKTTLIPVDDEIEIVKKIFQEYAERPNISIGQLQTELNKGGFTGHQSEKGFSRTTLSRMLSNPIYAKADDVLLQYYQKKQIEIVNEEDNWNGEFSCAIVGKNGRSLRADDLTGVMVYITNVKPVVDSRTFIMVQERMEQNKALSADNKPNNNLKELSGLLKCASCEMAVKMQKAPTMTCTGRSQKKICDVSFAGTKIDTVQKNVADEVNKYLQGLNETISNKRKRTDKIKKKIAELQKQLDNLIDLATFSDNVADTVKSRIDKLTVEIKELQLKLKTDDARGVIELRLGLHKNSVFTSLYNAHGELILNYEELDTEKRQMILRVLVDKILVYKDGTVKMIWKE